MKITKYLLAGLLSLAVLLGSRVQAQTLTTLHSFRGDITDGALPLALIDGGSGILYGTAEFGGSANDFGVVFKISTSGSYSNLHVFSGIDGIQPNSIVLGNNGTLYGGTSEGGTLTGGLLYKMTTAGVFTPIQSFGTDTLGNALSPGVIKGNDGNFYGAYSYQDGPQYGVIFKMTEAGTISILHTLNGYEGGEVSGLVQAHDGNLYGTCDWGAIGFTGEAGTGNGVFFKLTTSGNYTNLYNFQGGTDGKSPHVLIEGADHNFYGLTGELPLLNNTDTVFKITANGNLTTIHTFDGQDGRLPSYLIQANDNKLYGTTLVGGPGFNNTNIGFGLIYKMTTSGDSFATVVNFAGTNGSAPAVILQASDNKFYGTTINGGINGSGTVFKLDASITSSATLTISTTSPLPAGTVGSPYNTVLDATGGTGPYTWSIQNGSLPAGLSLVGSSGAITGTPTAVASANFTAKVTDSGTMTDSQAFTLSITSVVTSASVIGLSGNLSFGNVTTGNTATATLIITNKGNASLTVSNIVYPTGFSGDFSGAIAAGGAHAVTVTFTPPSIGIFSGTVTVNSDAGSGTSTTTASGSGIAAPTGEITVTKGKMGVNFAKPGKDSASFTVTASLGADFNPTSQSLTVSIGSVTLVFPLTAKGSGVSGKSTVRLKAQKNSPNWTIAIALKSGDWASEWSAIGLVNATIKKPGNPITVPIQISVGAQSFAANESLTYTATAGKSGSAK